MKYITFTTNSITYGVPVHVIAKIYAEDQAQLQPHSQRSDTYRTAHAYILDHPDELIEYAQDQVDFDVILAHVVVIEDDHNQVSKVWYYGDLEVQEIKWEQNLLV